MKHFEIIFVSDFGGKQKMILQYHSIEESEENQELNCCDEPVMSQARGSWTCQNCGTVLNQVFANNTRRAFTSEEVRNRKITEPVYSPIGPRTVIRGNKDARGSIIGSMNQVKYNRLGKIHRSLTSSYERNLWIALPNFQRIREKIGVPAPVLQDAIKIYQLSVKQKLTMGRSINILIGASLFVSFKIHGIPRIVDEIIVPLNVSKKRVVKAYRLLLIQVIPKLNLKVNHLGPIRYIDRIGEELELSMPIRKDSIRLLRTAKKNGLLLEGKDPKGLAAGALYLVSQLHNCPRTQREIATASFITEVTLRVRCRDLKKYCSVGAHKRAEKRRTEQRQHNLTPIQM